MAKPFKYPLRVMVTTNVKVSKKSLREATEVALEEQVINDPKITGARIVKARVTSVDED